MTHRIDFTSARKTTLVAAAIILVGCSADAVIAPAVPLPQAVAMPGVTVVTDTVALQGQVTPKGHVVLPLLPDSVPNVVMKWPPTAPAVRGQFRTANLGGIPLGITIASEIAPPVVSGQTLQATHIVVNGQWVYVAYAMIGAPTLGAVDVIQMGGGNAKLMSRATFTTTEYYAIETDGNYLYLAGATADSGFTERAVLDVVKLNGNKLPTTYTAIRIQLPSYAGTGVAVDGSTVWVTSGSGGANTGGLSIYDKSNLALKARYPFLDARGVHVANGYAAVMAGTPGTARIFNGSSRGQLGGPISIGGATVAESKGVAWVDQNFAFFAAGDGGMKVVGLSASGGTIRGSGLPIPNVVGVLPAVSTTNAVYVDDLASVVGFTGLRYMFVANGEAGVQSYVTDHQGLASTAIPALTGLGRIGFGTTISANFVAGGNGTLFVAAGLGGLKVLEY